MELHTIFLLYVSLFPRSILPLAPFPAVSLQGFFPPHPPGSYFLSTFLLPLWLPACLNSSFLNTYNHIPELKGKTLHRSLLRGGSGEEVFPFLVRIQVFDCWSVLSWRGNSIFFFPFTCTVIVLAWWFCISYMTHTSVDGKLPFISKELPAGAWVLRLTIALELSAENLIIKPKSQKHKHNCFCL